MLLTEAIEALLLATKTNGRSAQTLRDYREKLGHLVAFLGDVSIETITTTDLRRFVADMMDQSTLYEDHHRCAPIEGSLSPFTIAGRVQVLKRFFNWLVEEALLADNPARRIKRPNPRRLTPKGITREDLLALLKATEGEGLTDKRDRAITLFLADTGCRVGGLCGLRLGDVDLEARLARLTEKGSKTRLIPFSVVTEKALRDWLAVRPQGESDALFVTLGRWGHPEAAFSSRGVSQMLKRRADQAGIVGHVNPHSFRHAFARDFLLHGGDIGILSEIMGHSSVLTTKSFYGIFTVQQLQQQHTKHSPITQLFGKEGETDGE